MCWEGSKEGGRERERKAQKGNGTSHSQNAKSNRNPDKVPTERDGERERDFSLRSNYTHILMHLKEKKKIPLCPFSMKLTHTKNNGQVLGTRQDSAAKTQFWFLKVWMILEGTGLDEGPKAVSTVSRESIFLDSGLTFMGKRRFSVLRIKSSLNVCLN